VSTLGRFALLCIIALVAACTVSAPIGPPPARASGEIPAPSPTPPAPTLPPPAIEAPAPATPPSTGAQLAREVIEQLPVKGRAPKTGYSRAQFGPAWADVDGNRCDTRNDILQRDLTQVTLKNSARRCVVVEGLLVDPYSGVEMPYVLGTDASSAIHIDHVVSLSNAWQTGMFQSSPEERMAFANDPLNLLAVSGALNMQKGDGDAATWLPPLKAYRCEFVARQIAVKVEYQLWLTPPEKEAMLRVLKTCPGQVLPTP
jgi:hypothetical protein